MKIMPIYNLGHGKHQNKTNQLSQDGETNKTQKNWELIEWKIRFQNKKVEKKKKSGLSTSRNRWKPFKNLWWRGLGFWEREMNSYL